MDISTKLLPRSHRLTLLASSVSLLSYCAHAQEVTSLPSKQRVDSVVVTATRVATAQDALLAQSTVISREEIDAAGTTSLIDLLQRKANLDIRATGGPGQPASIFLRGTNATHTLVLVDGVRVSSSTSGSTAFENLPLSMIERVEIVKGPLSGQYGSDAIGGVVHIFTRRAKGDSASAEIFAGSFSERGLRADANLRSGDTQVSLHAATRRVDAPSATNPIAGSFTYNPDRDPYRNTVAKIGVVHTLASDSTVAIDLWQSRGEADYDSGAGFARNTQTLSGATLKLDHRVDQSWRTLASIAQTRDNIDSQSSFPSRFRTTQRQATWQNDLTLATGGVTLGAEHREESVLSTTRYDKATRTTGAAFASTQLSLDALRMQANLRRDQESQFGGRTTGGASVGVKLSNEQLLFASVGRAFRAPSFNDLYFPGFSNALLRPERSKSAEIAWRYVETKSQTRWNAAWFENRIDDLIAFDFVTSKPQNVRRARIRGLEVSVDTTLAGWQLAARATAQSPEDADTGKQLRSRAKHLGSVSASRAWGDWRVSADVASTDRRYDSANEASASVMPGYALINATLAYRVSKQVHVELVGQNLGGVEYVLARGYNQLGRSVLLRVVARSW